MRKIHFLTPFSYSLIILASALLSSAPAFGQKFEWVNTTMGVSWNKVLCDPSGDLVAVGSFVDTLYIGTKLHVSAYSGTSDVIIAKFDPQGNPIWSFSTGGTSSESISDVAIDRDGNIYALGGYGHEGYPFRIPRFAGIDLPRVPSNIFVAKFNSDGVFKWLRCPTDTIRGVAKFAVTEDGSIALTGSFKHRLQLGEKEIIASHVYGDIFLSKINSSGNVEWLKSISQMDTMTAPIVRFDQFENINLASELSRSTWHLLGHSLQRADSVDIIIARLSSAGLYDTVWHLGKQGRQHLNWFELDHGGNMYVLSSFRNIFDLGDTVHTASKYQEDLLIKFDRNGRRLWSRPIGPKESNVYAFALLENSIFYAFQFSIPMTVEGRILTPGDWDVATIALDENGRFKWLLQSSGAYGHLYTPETSNRVGAIYAIGYLNGTTHFGDTTVLRPPGNGVPQIFVKINQPAISTLSPDVLEYCPGDPIVVRFSTNGATGNSYSAYLSNADGAFASAVAIGQYSGSGDSVINARIPDDIPAGSRYRVRVAPPGAVSVGTDNGPYFTIHQRPQPTIEARKGTDFCEGSSLPLVAFGGVSYLWSNGDTTAAVEISTPGWHYVNVRNEYGCETRDSIKLTSHPYPNVQVSASGPTTFCKGGQVTLTATGAKSYLWSNGDRTQAITVKASGEYFVTGRGEGDCEKVSGHFVVTVHPLPAKPVITQADGILTSSSADGNEWYMAGGSRVDTTQQFKPTKSGKYYVRVTDSNGCSAQSDFIDVVVEQNGVAFEAISLFEVSPNPAKNVLTIRSSSLKRIELEIVDVLGASVFRLEQFEGERIVDIGSWPAGTYYVIAHMEGRTITRKFVKY